MIRESNNRTLETATLANLGGAFALSDPQKALEYLDQALPIWREVGEKLGEAQNRIRIELMLQIEADQISLNPSHQFDQYSILADQMEHGLNLFRSVASVQSVFYSTADFQDPLEK